MKLKTLKDIWKEANSSTAMYMKLKTEAVKQIKALENEKESIIHGNDFTKQGIAINDGEVVAVINGIKYSQEERNKVAQFLRYINNLTGEDLQ